MLRILKQLVKPAKVFEAPELRRRIVVLNSLMLAYTFFVFLMFLVGFFMPFTSTADRDNTQLTLLISILVFSAACALGRTKFYVAGGLLFTITIYIGCATAPFTSNDFNTLLGVMPFLTIPAVVGTFLFPLRIAILNLAVGVAISIGLPYYFDFHHMGTREAYLVIYNNIVYGILFLGTLLRVWDERQMLDDRLHMVKNSKMQTLGQMAGNIAHEMNTPLGAIILRASQIPRLLEKAEDLRTEKERVISIANDIEKIGKEIALTVDGLRRFSRNDEKRELQPILISEVIENTLRICRQKIEHNGIALDVSAYDPKLEVLGSEIQLGQVLLNLLTNAQQAIAKLPEKWIRISIEESPETIKILVTDSGTGIPSEIAAKIFDPFFTTKAIGEGTGLGLSISYGIIGQLKGRLYVDDSCPNTRFVISLPRLKKGHLRSSNTSVPA